jgi:phospholipid N-methyltransferase
VTTEPEAADEAAPYPGEPGDAAAPPARVPRTTDPRAARRAFWAAVVRHPGQVGAIAPTAGAMAELLARVVPRAGAPVVVELGAGTGAVTGVIDDRLPPGARHLAVELNPDMAGFLAGTHPGLEVIAGDAVKLGTLLDERGVDRVDAVVSALPWSLFDDWTQTAILDQIADVLESGGAFTTFAYRHGLLLSGGRRFRRRLFDTFEEVLVTATVLRNVPPAFAYVCRRPRRRTPE